MNQEEEPEKAEVLVMMMIKTLTSNEPQPITRMIMQRAYAGLRVIEIGMSLPLALSLRRELHLQSPGWMIQT